MKKGMKKGVYMIIAVAFGFLFPDIVTSVGNMIFDLQCDIVVEDKDEIRIKFYNNPSVNNLETLWGAIPYQANKLSQYDLFVYTWYVAFKYDDYSARYTLHRMLTDTILDDNHYIPNSAMKEFALKIKPQKAQTQNK